MLGTNRETAADAAPIAEATPVARSFAWADITPATAVAETITEAVDCDPLDLNPLGRVADTDALNTVAAPTTDSDTANLTVSFTYHGFLVVVRQTGEVSLYLADD